MKGMIIAVSALAILTSIPVTASTNNVLMNGESAISSDVNQPEVSTSYNNQIANKGISIQLTLANFLKETGNGHLRVSYYDTNGENYESLKNAWNHLISSSLNRYASFDCTEGINPEYCPQKQFLPSLREYSNGMATVFCDKESLMEEINNKKRKNNDSTKKETTNATTQTSEKLDDIKLGNRATIFTKHPTPLPFNTWPNIKEGFYCEDLSDERYEKAILSFILIRLYYGEKNKQSEVWFNLVHKYQSKKIPLQFAQINCEEHSEVCQQHYSSQSSISTSSGDHVMVFMNGQKLSDSIVNNQGSQHSSNVLENVVFNAVQTYQDSFPQNSNSWNTKILRGLSSRKGNWNRQYGFSSRNEDSHQTYQDSFPQNSNSWNTKISREHSSRKVKWNRQYGFSSRNGDSHRTIKTKKTINHFPGVCQQTTVSGTSSVGSCRNTWDNANGATGFSLTGSGNNNRIHGCTSGCQSGHLENLNDFFINCNGNSRNIQTASVGNSLNSYLNAFGVVKCKKLCNPFPPNFSPTTNGLTKIPFNIRQHMENGEMTKQDAQDDKNHVELSDMKNLKSITKKFPANGINNANSGTTATQSNPVGIPKLHEKAENKVGHENPLNSSNVDPSTPAGLNSLGGPSLSTTRGNINFKPPGILKKQSNGEDTPKTKKRVHFNEKIDYFPNDTQ